MIKKIRNWLIVKLKIVKPGIDIEIFGEVAIIRVETGNLPPAKASEYIKKQAELFSPEIKESMGVKHLIFIPYRRG